MNILDKHKEKYRQRQTEVMTLAEYLLKAKTDPGCYMSVHGRLLKAIGKPVLVDTSKDRKLARIFFSRTIRTYPAFADFFGQEEVIERLVSFLVHAEQGLEESKAVLYFKGPPGTAKSSLAERIKQLAEKEPIYVLASPDGTLSPCLESPLGLFTKADAEELQIPERYFRYPLSGWGAKRLREVDGDISQLKVVKMYPSQLHNLGITTTEAGDENTQDVSALVGKLDLRKVYEFGHDDPDSYKVGALGLANQGILDFVEMFKAALPMLNPLLSATQEGHYQGTEPVGAFPFAGMIVAHSNETEWEKFVSNKANEAFLDRIYLVDVLYTLRVSEEVKIYQKYLRNSSLNDSPCAEGSLKTLAEFCILSRLESPENSSVYTKMKVYDGEDVKEIDVKAKTYQEYKDLAEANNLEGHIGISTRMAFKMLSEAYNYDPTEVALDPVQLFVVIKKAIKREHYPADDEANLLAVIKEYLEPEYFKVIDKHIKMAYLDSYDSPGQAMHDRYVMLADHWLQDNEYRDPETGHMMDKPDINQELEKLEKAAGISNPKDFRHEIVNFVLRYKAQHEGKAPDWKAYEKIRKVIESNMFKNMKDLLPVISFGQKTNDKDSEKHAGFVERMCEMGYTKKQVRKLVQWHTEMLSKIK